MDKLEFNLYENALSSLNEALTKYCSAKEGDVHDYKFAISYLAHTLELLFKHYIVGIHPLLIIKNPFSDKMKSDQTIGMWEAVNFLKNSGVITDQQFSKDLEYLKNLRNDIEHYKFELDPSEVELKIGRLFHTLNEFVDQFNMPEVGEIINSEDYALFQETESTYEKQLAEAVKEVELAQAEAEAGLSMSDLAAGCGDIPILYCPACGEETLIRKESSPTGWECTFCREQEAPQVCMRCENFVEPYVGGDFCEACSNYIDSQ